MSVIKSFAVGNGDMFYISHESGTFTVIDCDLSDQNAATIIDEIKTQSASRSIYRFICTHPDEDHFGGLHLLDDAWPISNFYVVKNQAIKDKDTDSFKRYCQLRDDAKKAFYISKGCVRKWLNQGDDSRGSSGISVLWPDLDNVRFKEALAACEAGESYNNTSAVLRYSIGNTSVMWLGDLETGFMEDIEEDIDLKKTTVVFAAHHGRDSGKIPHSWLEKLDPQIIILGEAPSRHLNYYTGYQTITQNSAGDITMECDADQIHFFVSNPNYEGPELDDRNVDGPDSYLGSLTAETKYTL